MNRSTLIAAICSSVILSIAGCSSDPEPKPLGADQFYRPTDKSGTLPPGPAPRVEQPAPKPIETPQTNSENKEFINNQIQSPTPTIESAATQSSTFAPGQYLTVGGVVAEVNGNPIFADDVLRAVSPVLAAQAKDLDERRFKNSATLEINKQVDDMIRAEVEYAAAMRNTSSEDKALAERATEAWRMRMITESKGSIEEARQKFKTTLGKSFEEAAKEQNRLNLVRVYYSKKLLPRIQVTAEDLRKYYQTNAKSEFTDKDQISFRVIKVSIKDQGSDEAAKQKINDLLTRAGKGEDFETLAGFNQDQALLKNKGLIGPIDRNAYVVEDVEKAAWNLSPGQVTPVIKSGDAYYIAKVEAKKIGRTSGFDEESVQKKMHDTLRTQQFNDMRKDMETQLRKESVVTKNQQMLQTTLDMAMQNYSRWKNG